jgi:hypothetical protein
LPSGLTWDDSSQQLSGTVTDASQVGEAFSLVLQLAASDVLMDPLKVSLGITVQSAPAVASDMPPWEQIFIYAIAGSAFAMIALAVFAYRRGKTGEADEKTAKAVETAKTKVDNATNENPDSVSKSIVQTNNATLPTVEGNIQNRESLLNDINQKVKELNAQIAKNEATINELRQYVNEHKRDNWDAKVTDPALEKDYPTMGDAITGLGDLRQLNNAQMHEISTATEWSNDVTTKTTSDRNWIYESNVTQLNNNKLIEK